MDKYHLFRRSYLRAGKRIRKWYYWFYDKAGTQVRKATGKDTRERAQEFVDKLNRGERIAAGDERLTFAAFAADMFIPGKCPYLNRRREKDGFELKEHTRYIHRHNLERFLFPAFGSRPLQEVDGVEVEEYLLEVDVSNSVKNGIIQTLRIVLLEAQRRKIIAVIPTMEPFRRNSKRYDTLTDGELEALFPDDPEALGLVWSQPAYGLDPPRAGLMFGSMFCLMVSAGLRSGEARALHREQIYEEQGGIIVDRAFDSADVLSLPKKGTGSDPRHRAVPVPDRTIRILSRWLPFAPHHGPIFTYQGRPVSQSYLLARFELGIRTAGITGGDRRLKVHSLRYTYVTRMETLVSGQALREWTGHRSEQMTDLYSRPHLLDRLETHRDKREAINRFW